MFSTSNRYLLALREYSVKLIGEKADGHADTMERLAHGMVTDSDFRNVVQMLVDIYEAGYLKSYEDCKEQFLKHGIQVQVETEVR